METAEALPEALSERPALSAVKEDGQDERLVHCALGCTRHARRAEEVGVQAAERLAGGFDAAVDVDAVRAVAGDVLAKVLEGEDDLASVNRQRSARETRMWSSWCCSLERGCCHVP